MSRRRPTTRRSGDARELNTRTLRYTFEGLVRHAPPIRDAERSTPPVSGRGGWGGTHLNRASLFVLLRLDGENRVGGGDASRGGGHEGGDGLLEAEAGGLGGRRDGKDEKALTSAIVPVQ